MRTENLKLSKTAHEVIGKILGVRGGETKPFKSTNSGNAAQQLGETYRSIGNGIGLAIRIDRITSYNVCYTKLLRFAQHQIHEFGGTEEFSQVVQELVDFILAFFNKATIDQITFHCGVKAKMVQDCLYELDP